ncbi:MAG: SRPBCC domain-containing protein [Nocardioidaceae bacterium]|nr:SRPBCC domain-containing protein [Nocardioidaceae bacterium]
MSDGSRVLVAVRVAVPVERAFTAFTDQIDQWWRPNELFEFTPGRSGTMVFEPGAEGRLLERYEDGTEFVVGQVRVWDPPHRVVLGWRTAGFTDDQDTELHVRFDEVPGATPQTRVTVEHFGWDRIPAAQAVRHGFPLDVFQRRFAQWWQQQLAVLRVEVQLD